MDEQTHNAYDGLLELSRKLNKTMSGKQHEDIYNQMSQEERYNFIRRQLSGSTKSISEAAGGSNKRRIQELNQFVTPITDNDKQQAEIELSYINAAITLAQGSNDIGSEIVIGPFTIGISLNSRLISVLQEEADEIEKFLKGQPNNYE